MTTALGVYRNEETARAVARAVRDSEAVHNAPVVGDESDALVSLGAEMQAEVAESWGSPGVGVAATSEMMRGALTFMVVGAVIGIALGVPIGLALFSESSSLWVRAGVGALIGVVFGGPVGALLGGGLSMKSPEEPEAAQVGVTVRVDNASEAVEQLMAGFDPIRLDRLQGDDLVVTLRTDGPDGVKESIRQMGRTLADPNRQG
jgi:hypothetical protein